MAQWLKKRKIENWIRKNRTSINFAVENLLEFDTESGTKKIQRYQVCIEDCSPNNVHQLKSINSILWRCSNYSFQQRLELSFNLGSLFFQFIGCESDGACLLIDFTATHANKEAYLYLKLADGRIFTLPSNTAMTRRYRIKA